MSWINDLWKIVETVATLTKEVERANAQIKDLRTDLNNLTQSVLTLKADLAHQKETTALLLAGHKSDTLHIKESIDSKFDVLTSRLDLKIQDFEHRIPKPLPELTPRSLKPSSEN